MTKQSTYIEFYCHNSHRETIFVLIIDIYVFGDVSIYPQKMPMKETEILLPCFIVYVGEGPIQYDIIAFLDITALVYSILL